MSNKPIGVFDSGLGGLTTLCECKKLLPSENFIYLADSQNIPYGTKTDEQIKRRVFACTSALFDRGVKAVVVACNTATNAGIRELRNMYPCQFIGLEPALKPAYELFGDKGILLLCTEATANGQKLALLQQKLNAKNVIVSPQKRLAELIEKSIYESVKSEENIYFLFKEGKLNFFNLRAELERILNKYKSISAVVLGCTHYIFVRNLIQEILGDNVRIFDGNAGAAKRLEYLLRTNSLLNQSTFNGNIEFLSPLKKENI